ncbi:MAG TPA: hypothetical protein VFY90_10715 [Tepidiformaceae bacterium]|nr:hypothetical protein [Tepidiformaceae bacterium]
MSLRVLKRYLFVGLLADWHRTLRLSRPSVYATAPASEDDARRADLELAVINEEGQPSVRGFAVVEFTPAS